MAGRVEGKVAFITGAARGQGRSHAVRLAQEGADIIGVDLCSQISSVPYAMSTPEDLRETVRQVEALGRRMVAAQVDVRDFSGLKQALDSGVAELGRLDVVSANAAIATLGQGADLSEQAWQDVIDVDLTGVWHTAKVAVPHLVAGGRGGVIIFTGSTAALQAQRNIAGYVAAKHGLVGLMRAMALELAPQSIRVNAVHPTTVNTGMVQYPGNYRLFRPDLANPTVEDCMDAFYDLNALPVAWIEPADISNAVLFLASDEARYITGANLSVDAGFSVIK